MATWGGSTVDNLENITEDEDGGQERNERPGREEDEEDDGEIVRKENGGDIYIRGEFNKSLP